MKTMAIALGTALLLSGAAFAQSNKGPTNTNPNSASSLAPGHSTAGTPQAAPGQIQKNSTSGVQANDVAPGQVKNQTNTTGSTSTPKH